MGYKNVCLNCKRVENQGTDFTKFRIGNCPECGYPMAFVDYKFKPPKKTDSKAWKVVQFLIQHGFIFQHIFEKDKEGTYKQERRHQLPYPQKMDDAKVFVERYKAQAIVRPELK